jgi:DNA-binding protein HU-beta
MTTIVNIADISTFSLATSLSVLINSYAVRYPLPIQITTRHWRDRKVPVSLIRTANRSALAVLGRRPTEIATEAVWGDLVTLATKHFRKGDKIHLTGLGILQAARMGRNPVTGEAIKIKASKKIAFRPAKELKEAV